MPINVIHKVEYMAKKGGHSQELTFCDRKMNVIEDKVIVNNDTDGKTLEEPLFLVHKVIDESDNEDDDDPPQLVGHGKNGYYDSSNSNSSDDNSNTEDKDHNFYDNLDPGVSREMLETRHQMIHERWGVGFKDQDHKISIQEE